jgi:uncharacterized lipoprotein YddW (UPF0748 family)
MRGHPEMPGRYLGFSTMSTSIRLIVAMELMLAYATGRVQAADWPSPPREFRGVWVATVANIDWPSRKGLSTEQQKKELLAILDQVVALKLNAVIFQVRPMCDALYASKLEPWSEFLTGTLGKAPDPYYDPLEFAVREAHARGLELHAWFNPYRAHQPSATSPIPDNHVVKSRPDLAKRYGKHYWLNPTNPEVLDHSLRVFLDVVQRYDIDGIHLDDYFYPYKENGPDGKPMDFPDLDTWTAYQKTGGRLSRDDWRRDAVNRFVERMYRETKAAKPWVQVGVSPFGIWRPGNPPGIVGLDQYAVLYADAKLWFNQGWVDYLTPQLYWPIHQEKQSYPRLLAWWASENSKARHVWPGLSAGRATGRNVPATELVDEIKSTRAQPGATGNIFFSMKSLQRNRKVIESLESVYREPALIPASPWLSNAAPARPKLSWSPEGGHRSVRIELAPASVRLLVIRVLAGGKWSLSIKPVVSRQPTLVAIKEQNPDRIVVTSIDRFGNESTEAELPSR